MSRRHRRPPAPKSHASAPRLEVTHLTGEARELLTRLREAAAVVAGGHAMALQDEGRANPLGTASGLPLAPLDAVAGSIVVLAPLGAALRAGAESLVRMAGARTAEAREAARAPLAGVTEALGAATAAARDALPEAIARLPKTRARAHAKDLDAHLGRLLREASLSVTDRDAMLGTEHDGTPVLATTPVPLPTAHVWLLESVWERVAWALEFAEPLVALECLAAEWRFARWGGALAPSRDTFASRVRAQEYAWAERPLMGHDGTMLALYLEREWGAPLPRRERAVADAMARSIGGVFAVVGAKDHIVTMENAATGRRHRVWEHNPEVRVGSGLVAVGRLLPWADVEGDEDATFGSLRSPGMAYMAGDLALARDLQRTLDAIGGELPPGLAREAMLATVTAGRNPGLPLALEPALTRDEARAWRDELFEALRDAGFTRAMPGGARERGRARRGTKALLLEADVDVMEWYAALCEQESGHS